MYLAELHIENLRKLKHARLRFQPGLNIIIGANNVGKTAVIDALRTLLAGPEDYPVRLGIEDLHRAPGGGPPLQPITLKFIFRSLSSDDEADFLPALKVGDKDEFEVHLNVRYSDPDKHGRLRVRRWCGDHEEIGIPQDMLENLRGIYLPPLRDASHALRPNRTSQLARLLQFLAEDEGKTQIEEDMKELDEQLKTRKPMSDVQSAVSQQHETMIGSQLAQKLKIGLSANDFLRMTSRLSLTVDEMEVEQNGLGFNNLIYMAVVLSELSKDPAVAYRGLIVEEPEAHLHPQVQSVLLKYLETVHSSQPGTRDVQVFVTSHSPNFASIAKLDSLMCLFETTTGIQTFLPRTATFERAKKEKLERYLDATKAELFFTRRLILVEGAAEQMLLHVLAMKMGVNLRERAVSIINVEGLNFDCFLPLFGERAMNVRVAIVTDADPEGDDPAVLYPSGHSGPMVSAVVRGLLASQDASVQIFHGHKTFEYDLALHPENHTAMLKALAEIHPRIADSIETEIGTINDDNLKAKALFRGMFEREHNNVQKGRYGQALANVLCTGAPFACKVPSYLERAIRFASEL